MDFQKLEKLVESIVVSRSSTKEEKLQFICDLLQNEVPHYDWVGYYFANEDNKTLHLGPYTGEPTEHITIPFGKGICGQVAVSNTNFIVPDVTAQDNYIACSTTVKSEIVIPLFVNEKNIGQIDIDSHSIDVFTEKDEVFLMKINEIVSKLF
jgi:GAF domain-containing protein